jgi:excisionase family DNA binding protein
MKTPVLFRPGRFPVDQPTGFFSPDEVPLTVRHASVYLGVSVQTVYLWVERKQIPHFRVMGRNIRFLKSELDSFRAQFKQEVVEWQDQ